MLLLVSSVCSDLVSCHSVRRLPLQVLICSCFVPLYCGVVPPTYRGVVSPN